MWKMCLVLAAGSLPYEYTFNENAQARRKGEVGTGGQDKFACPEIFRGNIKKSEKLQQYPPNQFVVFRLT